MKKILLSLASLALLTPVYALDGEGTAANPFKIAKAADFAEIEAAPAGSYFVLENDIDFAGADYAAPFQKEGGNINFDGKNHVLKNMVCKSANAALFGLVDGVIKNLGIENSTFDCIVASEGWGPSGVFAAYLGNTTPSVIENCYADRCTVKGYYAGGLVGGTKQGLTITNCYSSANCESSKGFAGGLVGAISYAEGKDIPVNINKSYASGKVKAAAMAAGLVGGNQNYDHPVTGSEILNIEDVVAWNETVDATFVGIYGCTAATPALVLNIINQSAYCSDEMLLNGVPAEGGKTEAQLMELVLSWPAFAAGEDGALPVLKWQNGDSSGIEDLAVEEEDNARAVYYNLQGVEVANPENGIYIVRRGNKVTKEVIR